MLERDVQENDSKIIDVKKCIEYVALWGTTY